MLVEVYCKQGKTLLFYVNGSVQQLVWHLKLLPALH